MFVSLCRLAKSKNILVMLRSAAGTGVEMVAKRNRLKDKLVLRRYDHIVKSHVLFIEHKKIRSL